MSRTTEASTSLSASSSRMFEMGQMRSHDGFDDLGRGPEDDSRILPLTRRRLLGGASAGAVAIGTAPAWLAGCVTPQEEPWADGTFWSDGSGWIDDSAWL